MTPTVETRRPLQWMGRFFLGAGLAALGYCAAMLLYGYLFEARESRQFERELANAALRRTHPPGPPRALREGMTLGQLEIPNIGVSVMVLEGAGDGTLRRAVGHVPGTALPGQAGNVALAGHRDTFFRPLRNVHEGDQITLTTFNGQFRYRVDDLEIVRPEDVWVLEPSGGPSLTLITCYPFYYIGHAPKRFVVRARPTAP